MITVDGLTKTYPGTSDHLRAVDGLSFTVKEGEFYTLLGPSGCGKTTTLKCVAGLERGDGGTISLGDTVVMADRDFTPTHRRDIGMVFQNYAVWPHMTVFDNVAFPLRVQEKSRSRARYRDRVMQALELVNLTGFEDRMSTALSGGQQQRLSLARALVREPRVLLLDEPLSNLDAKLRESMRTELSLIQKRLGITALFVTHDQVEALAMSDRIAVMRNGAIVQEGTPREIYHQPADEFVASFVGSTNLFEGKASSPDDEARGSLSVEAAFGVLACQADSEDLPRGDVSVVIRPEDVRVHAMSEGLREKANVFEGRLEIGQFAGPFVEYHVTLGSGQRITALMSSRDDLPDGAAVLVELPMARCRVLARAGGAAASSRSEQKLDAA